MQVSSTRITLERREATGNISIILTVPFGCSFLQNGNLYNCSLHIEMNVPRESTKCQPEIVIVKSLTDQDNNCGYKHFKKRLANDTYHPYCICWYTSVWISRRRSSGRIKNWRNDGKSGMELDRAPGCFRSRVYFANKNQNFFDSLCYMNLSIWKTKLFAFIYTFMANVICWFVIPKTLF